MNASRVKRWLWSGLAVCMVLGGAAVVWIRVLHHGIPAGMMQDIRAGLAARHIEDPDERLLRYLEGKYGSMADRAHCQQAFLDFFNLDHIRALQLLVKHSPEARRQDNVDAMARWVAAYRASLTAEERTALQAQFQGEGNESLLKRATAQYNSQDVRYRGNTAPVISQLLRTLHEIGQPQ